MGPLLAHALVRDNTATWSCAVRLGAVVDADTVLVGEAHCLAGYPSVLVANTACHRVGAASWHRALLLL